jgi:hypothetical protein
VDGSNEIEEDEFSSLVDVLSLELLYSGIDATGREIGSRCNFLCNCGWNETRGCLSLDGVRP